LKLTHFEEAEQITNTPKEACPTGILKILKLDIKV
jgi:hypothetical protein